MCIRVFREEIYDATHSSFNGTELSREDLVQMARENGARQEVIDVLDLLPNRRFTNLHEIWNYTDVPITQSVGDQDTV